MHADTNSRTDILQSLLDERHSCRAFLPQPLPRETIERVISLAQKSASWCNAQPWQVHVLSAEATERARHDLLAHVQTQPPQPDIAFPEAYRGVYAERRRECAWRLYEAVGVTWGDRVASAKQTGENFRFFGAPHLAIVSSDASLGSYGAVDCGAFVGNFMLAAQSMGVASIAQAALAAYSPFWHAWLGMGADRQVVCGISFGHEDSAHPSNAFRTSRAALGEALTWVD
ncbi:nitroreductase [Variovorax sp. OV329]|uniref:nitroreductase n=1 Tax=Variovorax sp. OV329 TaxID=1882825 RepID=UPI0008DFC98A|nr:nitroreductase [Variovorax sp. OV329]SFN39867.1 Nitroreductase [Variovorax sp. OV329]